MVYNQKFIATVKVGKDFLREDKDTVLLPFGSEYSIYMKNLEGRTAVVSVSLDGQDVLDGNRLVLRSNGVMELEGFMKGSKTEAKFKFIQKTTKIQEHRGDKIDDGILRIEFQFEKIKLESFPWHTVTYNNFGQVKYSKGISTDNSRGISDINIYNSSISYSAEDTALDKMTRSCTTQSFSAPRAEEGITVKGSDSNQTFRNVTVGDLESERHVIVLKLMGISSTTETVVAQPVTVKTKFVCPTCGTTNKSINKFCRDCGTRLE